MNKTNEKCMPNRDVQERYRQLMKNIKKISNISQNSIKPKKLKSESEKFNKINSEFVSVSKCKKKRKLSVLLKFEKLYLICEWKQCNFNNESMDLFVKHVENHVTNLNVKTSGNREVHACLWSGCVYGSRIIIEIMRHVNYHAYHSKLMCIGMNTRERTKLPKCRRNTDWKNIFNSLPPHECHWNDCQEQPFNNYQLYLYHVLTHVENNPRGNRVAGGVQCLWRGCEGRYPNLYKLREHMRVHTKEKIIACPDCGTTFASNTKFQEHCKRQIPLEVSKYQCSHCNKYYPAECILKNHIRNHIFNYKCSTCYMSCDSPSSLVKHILYRHTTTRNFPCTKCSHAAKSQQDLELHMVLHSTGSNYHCNIKGCLFFCKYTNTLNRHVERIHQCKLRWYCCHKCPIKYKKSYRLTKHLIETHHLQLLSGHKRFQYVLQNDGCYKLQTVRYVSVNENMPFNKKPGDSNGNDEGEHSAGINQKINKLGSEKKASGKSMLEIPNILISIDEIDEHGNLIDNKVFETQETNELPPSEDPPIIIDSF